MNIFARSSTGGAAPDPNLPQQPQRVCPKDRITSLADLAARTKELHLYSPDAASAMSNMEFVLARAGHALLPEVVRFIREMFVQTPLVLAEENCPELYAKAKGVICAEQAYFAQVPRRRVHFTPDPGLSFPIGRITLESSGFKDHCCIVEFPGFRAEGSQDARAIQKFFEECRLGQIGAFEYVRDMGSEAIRRAKPEVFTANYVDIFFARRSVKGG